MAATDLPSDTAAEPDPPDDAAAASDDAAAASDRAAGGDRPWWRRLHPGVVLLVLVSYVPLLLTRPGEVGADTKTYLYLDPARLLSRAPFMWDPNVGLGTVTHQNIGYLWPMGPYYWLMETIGVPDWVAQRLWLGSIILAAGLGVRWMLKELHWSTTGATVAAFAYALSPYLLDYGGAHLGHPAALRRPAVAHRPVGQGAAPTRLGHPGDLRPGDAHRRRRQRHVAAAGDDRPAAVVRVRHVRRAEVRFGQAVGTALRIGVLTLVTSLWWMAGLAIQGAYGISILRYTETYETVANASLAPELVRGLGYWFFYGSDGLGAWTEASVGLVESAPLLILSFLIPGLAIVAGLFTRLRHRVFFASMVVVGLVVAVGAHPFESPSPYGALFKAFTSGDLGLSFRSTPRAVPLIALGLAVFLGAGVGALSRLRPSWHRLLAGGLIVLICINQAALFRGQMVDRNLQRDEELPAYWNEAAAAMDAGDRDTRVLEIPGIDFAAYRWGNSVDPITPGLTDREYAARELIPYGSPPSANLLNDVDLPFQSGRVDPAAIAPLARILGVGDIVLRADLQFERYRTPRPRQTFAELLAAPGLAEPVGFGAPVPNEASDLLPLDDEMSFSIPSSAADPAPVTLFGVEDPRPVLRTTSALAPTVLAGDGAALVALAAIGRLPADRPVFYSASFADDTDALQDIVDEPDSELVVSDTNRRQGRRWGAVRDNDGYTERAGEQPLVADATDNRLEVFPDETDDHRTVVEQLGGTTAAASRYGNGVTFTGSDRAANAVDGDPATAWRVAAFDDAVGEFIELDVDEPLTTDHLDLLQVQGAKNRHITAVELSFDDGDPVPVELSEASRGGEGQRIDIGERTFSRVRITITGTDPADRASWKGISDVGFAEIGIDGMAPVVEVVRPPVDLLDTVGESSIDRPLTYLFTRRAAKATDVIASDEEPTMRRWVIGPVDRRYTIYGTARLDVRLDDASLDTMLGHRDAAAGGVTATSSTRLPGSPASRASSAVDGDSDTAYTSPLGGGVGAELEFTYAEPVTVDDLQLEVLSDGRHSVPDVVSVSVDGAPPVQHRLDGVALGDGEPRDTTRTLTVPTGQLTGTTFRITVDSVVEAESKDWFGGARTVMPIGIAEVGLPAVEAPPADTPLDAPCRTDLVTIDGEPVAVRVVGTVGEAEAGDPLDLEACDGAAGGAAGASSDGVAIPAGKVLLETHGAPDVDVDVLALSSAAGGAAGTDTLETPLDDGPAPPSTTTDRAGRNAYRVDVRDAEEPYWVVLGQSFGPGWSARVVDAGSGNQGGGDEVDLGAPTLVNGYANGWRVDPSKVGPDATIEISWTPQRLVWVGLGLSALGVLACLVLIVVGALRRRTRASTTEIAEAGAAMEPTWAGLRAVDGDSLPIGRAVVGALVAGVVVGLAAGPLVGAAIAVVTGVGLGVRSGQRWLRLSSVVMAAASFGFIVAKQLHYGYEIDFDWVSNFELTHSWTMFAILALLAAVVVDLIRSGEDA